MTKRYTKKEIYVLDCDAVSVMVESDKSMIRINADTNWLELNYEEMVAIHSIFSEIIDNT